MWVAGDLAHCINDEWMWVDDPEAEFPEPVPGPGNGWCGRVIKVTIDPVGCTMLHFDEYPDPTGYQASQFKKIQPDKAEACEAEFVTLLKRSRDKVYNPDFWYDDVEV